MTPFIWQDRLVKLEDGCLMFSAKGRHDDFGCFPKNPGDETAMAMTLDPGIYGAYEMPDGRLAIETFGGTHTMASDKFWTEGQVDPPELPVAVPVKEG